MELIPLKATFTPGEPVEVELVGGRGATTVQLWDLDRLITEVRVEGDRPWARFEDVAEGGYGLLATDTAGARATGAVDVLADPFTRPRYGFVADFPADETPDALVDTTRRLHLNLIQFYDWAHRYAQLVPDTPEYLDPLGRQLSLHTVRAMTAALRRSGSLPMGYAAVYAVGGMDWAAWQHAGLFKADGQPHRFTDDLLLVVDPANPEWMKHFAADLRQAMAEVGFDGFHLDSYGWPKRAYRADGSVCDLNDAFPVLLNHLRTDVPGGRLLFNNVNDFPTWSTTQTRQDGTYIEVWPPHTTLGHLGGLVERARAFQPGRPPILAAYLTTYALAAAETSQPGPEATTTPAEVHPADTTAQLTMATIFSHGGTHLLNGAGGTVLVDPYYPKNYTTTESTRRLMQTWYDFLVRYGDLLLDPAAVDVTRSYTGGINEDLIFQTPTGVQISTDPHSGTVWVRVVRTRLGLVLHLINLRDQQETGWDTTKRPVTGISGIRLRALKTLAMLPPRFAAPDGDPALRLLPVHSDAAYDVIDLPALGTWTMVVLPDPATWPAAH